MNIQQGDDEAIAYVLRWRDREVSKEYISSAKDLRARIEDETKDDERRVVFVIHGLPVDYVEVLRDLLDIDPYFVEAHVRRRTYRPLGRRKDKDTIFAHWDYPELVRSSMIRSTTASDDDDDDDSKQIIGVATFPDIVGNSPVHMISNMGDEALFCRASLWLSPRANILFVDRSSCRDPVSSLRKTLQRNGISKTSKPGATLTARNPLAREVMGNGEMPSLETLLYENLADSCESSLDLWYLLEDIATRQWFDFFEAVPIDVPISLAETMAMYWQIQDSLERNLGNRTPPHSPHGSSAANTGWEALLARVGRRTQLLGHLNDMQVLPQTGTAGRRASNLDSSNQGDDFYNSEENKRGLDRVAYMGGVLLPLSIVSGILSMGEPFGPGGSMFFVYWAAAVPLTLVTLLIIYADSIRKAEVWIEVAAADATTTTTTTTPHPKTMTMTMTTTPQLEHGLGFSHDEATDPGPAADALLAGRARIVEKMFPGAAAGREKHWRKGELGWAGACMTALRLYKLKTGAPPGRQVRSSGRHARVA
ncbi:hypothetical protein F5X99DRAFT_4992 [Biscogniauxia marginata]|nr:hypothetical protein F5X99DRAFT_4992 [Biscogniauxia marginata]